MSHAKYFLPLLLVFLSLNSCQITKYVGTMQIEIMKPGIFVFPENINTVSVFNRDLFKPDSCIYTYYNGIKVIADSTIRCRMLSNTCVNAFANSIKKEGYFQNVINYRDSVNSLWSGDVSINNQDKFFEQTNSDIYIFLDFFNLKNTCFNYNQDLYTEARLSWTIVFKIDTSSYVYNQVDTLIYEGNQELAISTKNSGPKLTLMNASEYLGNSFGTKIIPSWLPVDRIYYKSNNQNMLKAENFALNNDWLKAAEIWNRETKNKNLKIAAKASYNMALACEMEGKHDVGIDWLIRSYSSLSKNNEEHKANCKRYINILAMRKKEIERLGKQVRN